MAKKDEELVTQGDELAEQTFGGGFDGDITVTRESDGVTSESSSYENSSASIKNTKKKSSSNVIIFGVVGLAAVGIFGYKMFMGDAPVSQEQVAPPVNLVAPQEAQVEPEPVVIEQPQSTPPAMLEGEQVGVNSPSTSITGLMAPEVKAVPKTEIAEVIKQEVTVIPPPEVKVVTPVVSNKAMPSSSESVEVQMKRLNDMMISQDKEFALLMGRMANIEEKMGAIIDGYSKSSPIAQKNNEAKSVSYSGKKKSTKAKSKKDSSVLFEKSLPVVKEEKLPKVEDVEIKGYNIYSMYSGRFWIKNYDGTLSSFAIGDKMPNGEKIKKVDMDAKLVKTDKGFIKVN